MERGDYKIRVIRILLDPRYAHAFKLESRSATLAPRGWRRFIQDHPRLGRPWRLAARALALAEDAIPSEKLFDLCSRGAAPWHDVARGGLRAAFRLRARHAGKPKVRH